MLKDLFKKNWLTSTMGVLLIAGALGNGLQCLYAGGDFFSCVNDAWVQILAGFGFIGAKDAISKQ